MFLNNLWNKKSKFAHSGNIYVQCSMWYIYYTMYLLFPSFGIGNFLCMECCAWHKIYAIWNIKLQNTEKKNTDHTRFHVHILRIGFHLWDETIYSDTLDSHANIGTTSPSEEFHDLICIILPSPAMFGLDKNKS